MGNDVFSNLKLTPVKNSKSMFRAYGEVLVAGSVKIKFSVFDSKNGPFAKLPGRKGSKPDAEGKFPWYPDIIIPDKELYKQFQTMVVTEYSSVMGSNQGNSTTGEEPQDENYNDGIPF